MPIGNDGQHRGANPFRKSKVPHHRHTPRDGNIDIYGAEVIFKPDLPDALF
jgi:hypothetical protein